MKRYIYIILGVSLLVSSCQAYKDLHREYTPQNNIADNLFGQGIPVAEGSDSLNTFGNKPWRELFNDSRLVELIDHALVNNSDIQLSRTRVEEMETALLVAKKALLPSVVFATQGSWTSFNSNNIKTYTFPVTAQWQADIFGSIHNKKQQAKVLKYQSEDMLQATQCQLIANIANLYYNLLMLDKQLEIVNKTIEIRSKAVNTQSALMEAGMVTSAAVDQMKASYFDALTQKISLEKAISQEENALCILLGDTPHSIMRSTMSEVNLPHNVNIGLPVYLLSNRPDVRSAQRSIESAFYFTQSAKAELYPNLSLSGTLGWTDNGPAGIVDPGKIILSAVASITQPIFAQGRIRGNIRLSELQQNEARTVFVQTVLQAGREVNDALIVMQSAAKKEDVLKQQVGALQSAYSATQELMLHGQGTYLEVLMSQESLLAAQLAEVANQYDAIQGLISLYIALGGGR